jgi:solute carrier family 35 protein F1/2
MSSGLQPPRASSYTREILLRLKRSTWEQRYVLGAVFLGQFLSLCLCGTGVTSQVLVTDYDISVPTTQCFLNYVLLGLTFGVHFATKKRFLRTLKYNWWKYLILGVVDVEANFLMVLAYRYTNLTSVQLLDCFTIVVVMVLSFVFLKTRYKLINIIGVLLTVIGITCLVFADFNSARNNGGSAMWLGDMLCLVGAVLYAAGNVTQEYLVKSHTILEYLGFIGVVGSFVSGAQL